MILPGLVSVTFRKLGVREIVELCGRAGLIGLEWGGDVHVPPGELVVAREVGKVTREAGLQVVAYGSYYRLGGEEAAQSTFAEVLETAVALGAPTIRVWAGQAGSAAVEEDVWKRIVEDWHRTAALAGAEDLTVSLEYHANTLADDRQAVARLMENAPPAGRFLWQPSNHYPPADRLPALLEVLPLLQHVHCYFWREKGERRPLAEGWTEWKPYLAELPIESRVIPLLLEFVKDNRPEQLLEDAAVLRDWIQQRESCGTSAAAAM
jgi:3-dehydroshikimate dehydratase